MTIQSESIKAGPFDGNDSTTVFPFTFKVFQAADLGVILTDISEIESTLILDTDYSVSLNADQEASPGGSVTYPIAGDPLATGEKLTILNALEFTQGTDLQNGGAWSPETVEDALDRLTMLSQRNQEEVSRSVKVDVSSGDDPADLLDSIDEAVLAAEAAQAASEAAQAASEAVYDEFDDRYLGSKNADPVLDNDGDALLESALYWNTVTKRLRIYNSVAWENVATTISQVMSITEFVATNGQTTFSGLTYTPGLLFVILNGNILDTSDYTATNGTSVVLNEGAALNDILSVLAFGSFNIANTYTKAEINGAAAITPDINGGTIGGATVGDDLTANGETITPTKLGYLNDVTADIQAQLDSKAGVFRGARYRMSTGGSCYISNASITGVCGSVTTEYDTDSIVTPANGRLTVPAGVTKIRLTGQVAYATGPAADFFLRIIKNGSSTWAGSPRHSLRFEYVSEIVAIPFDTGVISVVAGDYFMMSSWHNSGAARAMADDYTWFGMEIVG